MWSRCLFVIVVTYLGGVFFLDAVIVTEKEKFFSFLHFVRSDMRGVLDRFVVSMNKDYSNYIIIYTYFLT